MARMPKLDIKPCPVCGSKAKADRLDMSHNHYGFRKRTIRCTNEHCSMVLSSNTLNMAMRAWNNRED